MSTNEGVVTLIRRRSVLLLALTPLILVGCTGSHNASNVGGTTQSPAPTTTPTPTPVVGWSGGPLSVPLEADDEALVVLDGNPPATVSHDQAVALAQQAVTGVHWSRSTIQVLAGSATISPQLVLIGQGVPTVADAPAWVVAYHDDVAASCPAIPAIRSVPSTAPTASVLDAVVITGPGIEQVIIYHGTGTGPCVASSGPAADSATRP